MMEWKTAIAEVKDNEVRVRGYALQDLIGKLTYSQVLALLLRGELPTPEEHILLDAILVAASERGAQAPSTLITRQAASAGAPVHSAVTAGLLSLSSETGLAVESCMSRIFDTMDLVSEKGMPLEDAAMAVVETALSDRGRLPGFGTAAQEPDQVATTLLGLIEGLDLPLAGACSVVRALEVALAAQTDRHIPINLSGAIAAALCEMNFPAEVGNAFYLMGRLPGLVTHFVEERMRQKAGRLVSGSEAGYDGPEPRELI
jgi:citrate synthase